MGMEGSFEIDQYNNIIDHKIETTEGQSGSPLYIQRNGICYILGIHVREISSKNLSNKAVFLKKTRIEQIRRWINDYYIKQGPIVMKNGQDGRRPVPNPLFILIQLMGDLS
jgi:hypothetical protein